MANQGKTVLLVGATRGLGLGLARRYLEQGWQVIATSRGRNDEALRGLTDTFGARLRIEQLDVIDTGAVTALAENLQNSALDLLFVSAGISGGRHGSIADATPDDFNRVMLTNAYAPLKIIEALGSRVPADSGAIVAMSSILGSVGGNTSGGWDVYRASKAALNTLLRSYAAQHQDRSVVAMHPGYVRTDMGGPNATIGVEDSVPGIVDVIDSRLGKPGCFYLDYKGQTLPW